MRFSEEYSLRESWIVCINIRPDYWNDLILMSNNNISDFLEYLYNKFKRRLFYLNVSSRKRTATADYQPNGEGYTKKKIEIAPNLWQKYWDLRLGTGYSMSCIIRIFIEWEKIDRNEFTSRRPLVQVISIRDEQNIEFRSLDNYQIIRRWRREGNWLFFSYWDDS